MSDLEDNQYFAMAKLQNDKQKQSQRLRKATSFEDQGMSPKVRKPEVPFQTTEIYSISQHIKKQQNTKHKNYLVIMYYVNKFKFAMLDIVKNRKYNRLKQPQFAIINDVLKDNVEQIDEYDQDIDFDYLLLKEGSNYQTNFKNSLEKVQIIIFLKHLQKKTTVRIIEVILLIFAKLKFPLIQAISYRSQLFQLILILYLLINVYYLPVQMSFDVIQNTSDSSFNQSQQVESRLKLTLTNPWLLNLDFIPFLQLIIDSFFQMNTTYFDKGQHIKVSDIVFKQYILKDRKKILIHYKREFLLQDFLSIVPEAILFIAYERQNKYQNIFYAILLIRVYKLKKKFERLKYNIQEISILKEGIIKFIKLLAIVMFYINVWGCAAHAFAQYRMQQNDSLTWLTLLSIQDDPWLVRYISSLFYASTIFISLGSYHTKSNIEMAFHIFMILALMHGFSYFQQTFQQIFVSIKEINADLKVKIADLTCYMKHRGIGLQLQSQIMAHIEYSHYNAIKGSERGLQSIAKLIPTNLKKQLNNDFIMQQIRLFNIMKLQPISIRFDSNYGLKLDSMYVPSQTQFSEQFLQSLGLVFKERSYMNQEVIYDYEFYQERNMTNQPKIYWVVSGSVDVFYKVNRQNHFIRTARKGDCIGFEQLFRNQILNLKIVSNEVSMLIIITQEKFLKVIRQFSLDYELFCMCRDLLTIYNKQMHLGIKCNACKSTSHTFQNCQLISFQPQKQMILKFYLQQNRQKRKQFIRKRNQRINALCQQKKFLLDHFKIIKKSQLKSLQTAPIQNLEFVNDDFSKNRLQNNFQLNKLHDINEYKNPQINKIYNQIDQIKQIIRMSFAETNQTQQQKKMSRIQNLMPDSSNINIKQTYNGSFLNSIEEEEYEEEQEIEEIEYDQNKYSRITITDQDFNYEFTQKFDIAKNYSLYFPYNNIISIITRYKLNNNRARRRNNVLIRANTDQIRQLRFQAGRKGSLNYKEKSHSFQHKDCQNFIASLNKIDK